MKPEHPEKILKRIYMKAEAMRSKSLVARKETREKIESVCQCLSNRAGVRLLMSCLLGKLHNPGVDPRKPYTEIGSADCFSGRTYDEHYLTPFINRHRLPCNITTAYLTPTLRNINQALTPERELVGRPRQMYKNALLLLDDVANNRLQADTLLVEIVRNLIGIRDQNIARIKSLLNSQIHSKGALPLSSEAIIALLQQHLACRNSSRLPVLIVAAAYKAAGSKLAEQLTPLHPHNAADFQTGSFGDIEICLAGEDSVVTVYEMKQKRVTQDDINTAMRKIAQIPNHINNYLFITTETIDPAVLEYARNLYGDLGGTEKAILDCVGFLRHFLHLFHRIRMEYLDAYQALLLEEPDSAVSQSLKEAFLVLRQAAESGE